MAENKNDANGGALQDDPETSEPRITVVAQYIRDLSFENPGIGMSVQRPQIDLGVDLQAQGLTEPHQYEVTLKLRVGATQDEKPIFLLELLYGGLFQLINIPDESVQPMLLIECPRLIFPFARRIVSDVVRDGGLPPLLIEPIDFAALYRAKLAEQAGQREATA
jgi:preprotein translocase subunit SecB